VKYRERLADLREELVMIQKVDNLCIEKLSEHHRGFGSARPSLDRPVALHRGSTEDTQYRDNHHEFNEGEAMSSTHSRFPVRLEHVDNALW